MGGTGGKANSGTAPALPWGTPVREHRLNPWLVGSLRERLDAVEDNCACLVVHAEGTFFSNGLDLAWIDAHGGDGEAARFASSVDALFARLLTFPVPTVAAINGHWCAAGGMQGCALTFGHAADRGYFLCPWTWESCTPGFKSS